MAACKRTTPMYSLPADCCDLTNRVALSMHTMRHPVTFGSSVPEWPVLICVRVRWRWRVWRSGRNGTGLRWGLGLGLEVEVEVEVRVEVTVVVAVAVGWRWCSGARKSAAQRSSDSAQRLSTRDTQRAPCDTHLLDAKDPLYPGHDLVRRRVSGLVQVDAPVLDILIQWTLERRAAARYGCVVRGADVQLIIVLQEQRPRVGGGSDE